MQRARVAQLYMKQDDRTSAKFAQSLVSRNLANESGITKVGVGEGVKVAGLEYLKAYKL
jgi:hypothetical protein